MDKSEFESRYFDLVSKAPGKTFLFYGNLKEDMIRWSASAVEYFGLSGEISEIPRGSGSAGFIRRMWNHIQIVLWSFSMA